MPADFQQQLLRPEWKVPRNVHAAVVTRQFAIDPAKNSKNFSLALHTGDEPRQILINRAGLNTVLGSELKMQWLRQVHGNTVLRVTDKPEIPDPQADGIYCNKPGMVCGVLTADCLPVLFTNTTGDEVAVAHAGWRGLAAGILENTVDCFNSPAEEIIAWLGPAIGPCHFEVGDDVRQAFLHNNKDIAVEQAMSEAFVRADTEGKWMADLYLLAKLKLAQKGINKVAGGDFCTCCQHELFFSYRKAEDTGRFATIIWYD